MILDELVGVEHIAADLTPEADVLRRASFLGELSLPLLLLELDEPRFEDPERRLLVRGLRALVLALDDDSRRQMRDPDRGVGLVHVLAAGAGGTVGVDAEVGLVDLDIALLGQEWRDDDLREGGVATVRAVERRLADEPVDAAL